MYVEVQLIKSNAGVWLVGIDENGSKAHDFFNTKEEAIQFVAGFLPYHGAKLVEAKSAEMAPETTQEKVQGYRADATACNCPDYVYRNGGSYVDQYANKCCKHMLAVATQPKQQSKASDDADPFACFAE